MAYGKRLQWKSDKKAHIKSLGTFWKWSFSQKKAKDVWENTNVATGSTIIETNLEHSENVT